MPVLDRRTKRITLGFFFAILLVIIVVFFAGRFRTSPPESHGSEVRQEGFAPPAVSAVVIQAEEIRSLRKFPAELGPWMRLTIHSDVAGRVVETFAKVGDKVKKGAPLLRLDETRPRVEFDLALARHTEASRLLVETERLLNSHIVSQNAYEASLAGVRLTRARLDEARDILAKHTIAAPFTSVVNERRVDVGDTVYTGQELATLVDLDKLRVSIHVPASDLPLFPKGTKRKLRLPSMPEGVLEPEVLFVNSSADPQTHLFKIEAILDNPQHVVPSGVPGVVEAEVEMFPVGPVVPAAAVRFVEGAAVVLKVSASGPVPQKIQVGPVIDGRFPVLEGLAIGDKVIVP